MKYRGPQTLLLFWCYKTLWMFFLGKWCHVDTFIQLLQGANLLIFSLLSFAQIHQQGWVSSSLVGYLVEIDWFSMMEIKWPDQVTSLWLTLAAENIVSLFWETEVRRLENHSVNRWKTARQLGLAVKPADRSPVSRNCGYHLVKMIREAKHRKIDYNWQMSGLRDRWDSNELNFRQLLARSILMGLGQLQRIAL